MSKLIAVALLLLTSIAASTHIYAETPLQALKASAAGGNDPLQILREINDDLGLSSLRDPFAIEPEDDSTTDTEAPKLPAESTTTTEEAPAPLPETTPAAPKIPVVEDKTEAPDTPMPAIAMQGYLAAGKQQLALLSIAGMGTLVVQAGDTIGLQQLGSNDEYTILAVNPRSLVIKSQQLDQEMVVQ